MNKLYSIMALGLMMAANVSAQTETNPNRIIIDSKLGQKAYAVDYINNITFAKKEGEVKAALQFIEYKKTEEQGDIVTVAVTRSDPNSQFSIAVLPTNTAKRYDTDDIVARYFEMQGSTKYSQDFTHGDLSGFETPFSANTSYTVLTMAYDEYGVPCESDRVEFTTPKVATVGNPTVTYNIDELTTSSVTLTVTPNEDCKEFYWCQFDKGGAESQFEQWGPMMGYANVEEMVKGFSQQPHSGTETNTWDGLAPGKDYEVLVLPVDVNGNFGEMVPIYFTTTKQGGEGTAEVSIEIGGYNNVFGTNLQTVTFTPNSETAMFRDVICNKDSYEPNGGDEWAVSYLQTEYPFEVPNWNQYSTDEYKFEADPSTSYYALALAKNANNEWGPLTKVEFTTPASPANVAPAKASSSVIMQRISSNSNAKRGGVVPAMKSLKLSESK